MKTPSCSERFAPVALYLLTCVLVGAATRAQGLQIQRFRANAGPDRTLVPPATSVQLQGSLEAVKFASVPSDFAVSWVQLAGPPALIVNEDTFTPTVFPSSAGSLLLRFKVIQTPTNSDSDEVQIQVQQLGQEPEISGERRKWHKLALTFTHDQALGESSPVNPFLDLRLNVRFQHVESGAVLSVPGFFAADGNAAETGATEGTRWRVNFTPDRAGTWIYTATFRAGSGIALNPILGAGQPTSFDGANGVLFVENADPNAPGFLSQGRLDYVGEHQLRFAETHEYFLKSGAGSPENFLGYFEFDGTFDQGGPSNELNSSGAFDGLHHYDAHLSDYVDRGVPLWQNGKGRRLFGALSYLASRGVNSLYTLSFNTDGGDGQEVWPWSPATDKLRFDVSKLAQWERMLDHMTREGIVWHVVTQETENDHALDGGALATERRLYYRELVARFAYAPGLVWNLGEENTNSTEERMAFADSLHALDPYDHPVSLHNLVGTLADTFGPLLGTHLELLSIQGDPVQTPPRVQQLVLDSAAAGRPWVVNFDEQTPANDGVVPDSVDFGHDLIRREALWPMLLGQGGGCDWYFGYGHPHSDLSCEDFRSRENLWGLTARALEFLQEHVPFHELEHADLLATGNGPSVLAKGGEFYLVYLPFGGQATLDLEGHDGPFRVSWFDAQNGGALQDGAVTQVSGPGPVALDAPPASGDWVAFVRRTANLAPVIESLTAEPAHFFGGQDFAIQLHAHDPNGPFDALSASAQVRDPAGVLVLTVPLLHRRGSLYSHFKPAAPGLTPGTWQLLVTVVDGAGASATQSASFEAF